jgi:hypothetical protein
MDLSESNPAVPQSDPGASFHLPPVAFAIQAAKACEIADSATCGDRFDVANVADQLEVQAPGFYSVFGCQERFNGFAAFNLGNRVKPVCCVAA